MEDDIMTFDEILTDKTYQSEFDKRVTKALETAKTKWDTDASGKEAAFLADLGIKSKDEIPAFKEQIAAFKAEKEKGQTAEEKLKAYEEQQDALKAERDAAITEREQARQEAWCIKQGIPEDKADFYLFKIGKLMAAEGIDFNTAAAQYLKENPAEEKQETKPMWGGSAKKTVGSVDDEINQWRAEAGLKVKEK